ncbi:sugar ABC transporter permease [Micrococcales bacterium 31B]|nr:sugar ABC transporter permease [Micrococcales bacterium 31B]
MARRREGHLHRRAGGPHWHQARSRGLQGRAGVGEVSTQISLEKDAPGAAPPLGTRPRRGRGHLAERLGGYLFLAPAVLFVVLFFGYPLVQNLIMSFQEYTSATFFTGVAPWVGFANYQTVFADPLFGKALTNTALFTAASLAGQFVLGLGLALFFHRKFPLNGVLRSLLLLPWLLPILVSAAVWKWVLDQDTGILNRALQAAHLINEPISWLNSPSVALVSVILVNIWLGIPFNVALLYSGLQTIPDELYEAGQLDGATGFKAFAHITWPLLRPVVGVVLLLGMVYTIKVLDLILGLTGGGPANATQTLATRSYEMSFVDFHFGEGAAMSNVLMVIALLLALVYLRSQRQSLKKEAA